MARSNRQLTQFAVDKLRQYLVLGPGREPLTKHKGDLRESFFSCTQCHRKL